MDFEILTAASSAPLEEALLVRIDRARRADLFRPLLIVAPTGRILVRLRRLLAASGATRWGLHLLHHRALAERIVETSGEVPLRVLRSRDQRSLLSEILRASRHANGTLAAWGREQGGGLSALHRSLREMREANLDPRAALELAGRLGHSAEVGRIYADYCAALVSLAASGRGDAAELSRQACALAGRSTLVSEAAGLFHHGAYDLTGAHRALVSAIAERVPTVLLVPGVAAGPAFEHARVTLERWVGAERLAAARPARLMDPDEGMTFASRACSLYDAEASLPPVERDRIEIVSAPGVEIELETAARRVLALHVGGMPLEEIAIVARSLEPYAPHLESILERDHGLPFVTSARIPLRRDPGIRAFRDLTRALVDDFPARPLMDYLRSAAARLDDLLPRGTQVQPDIWHRLARRAGVVGGAEGWTFDLTDWALDELRSAEEEPSTSEEASGRLRRIEHARERLRASETLARLVASLIASREEWESLCGWSDHAAYLSKLVRARLLTPKSPAGRLAREALASLLKDLAGRDELLVASGTPAPRKVSVAEACRALLEGIDGETLAMKPAQGPGLQVLDVMKARGLSFRAVLWLGLSAGAVPLRPRPEPCLPDSARELLREQTGAPLALTREMRAEERLLVAATLSAAREHLTLSWQRADQEGRGKAPSLIWRELARVLAGSAEGRLLTDSTGETVGRTRLIPLHPAYRAASEAEGGSGLVPFRDAAVALASQLDDPASAIARLPRGASRPERPHADSLSHALLTGSFETSDLSRDGYSGDVLPAEALWTPSDLQLMGRCPLQYFFRKRLNLRALDRPAGEAAIDPKEIGTRVHRVLQRFYRQLATSEGTASFTKEPAGSLEAIDRSAGETLEALFKEETSLMARRVSRRFPALWKATEQRWLAALARVVRWDLRRLWDEKVERLEMETTLRSEIPLSGRKTLTVEGRLDRLDTLPGGALRIVDYKTSRGDPSDLVNPGNAVRGEWLQLPLYRLLAAAERRPPRGLAEVRVQAVSIGPDVPSPEVDLDEAPSLGPERFEGLKGDSDIDRSFRETLGNLAAMAQRGEFPLNPGDHCGFCDYRIACRPLHPPTVERARCAPLYRPYFLIRSKSIRELFPSRVRGIEEEELEVE